MLLNYDPKVFNFFSLFELRMFISPIDAKEKQCARV